MHSLELECDLTYNLADDLTADLADNLADDFADDLADDLVDEWNCESDSEHVHWFLWMVTNIENSMEIAG